MPDQTGSGFHPGTGSSIEHNSSTTEPLHISVATNLPDQTGSGFYPGTGSSIEHNSSTTEPIHLSIATTLPDQTGSGFHPGTDSSIEHKSSITEHLHLSVATTCELSDRFAAEPLLGSSALQEVTFTRLAQPRGRPRNKQLFTSRKRKKEGPKKFENLSLEKRQGLLLRAVCRPHESLGTGIISSAELRDFSDFDDIILDSTLSL